MAYVSHWEKLNALRQMVLKILDILCVLCSMAAFKSGFSCLTSRKSICRSVRTTFRLFDCSILNWSNNTRTPALQSVQSYPENGQT